MSQKNKRGRPRAFDTDAALKAATDVFWTQGLSGASLDQLAAATGVARPSLAAAFGDKTAFYLRAMFHFARRVGDAGAEVMGGDAPLRDELLAFFDAAIDIYTQHTDAQRGCPVFCTMPAEATQSEEVRTALSETLTGCDAMFARRFQMACDKGELPKTADPQALGVMAAALMQTLAIRARAGSDRDQLHTIVQETVAVLSAAA